LFIVKRKRGRPKKEAQAQPDLSLEETSRVLRKRQGDRSSGGGFSLSFFDNLEPLVPVMAEKPKKPKKTTSKIIPKSKSKPMKKSTSNQKKKASASIMLNTRSIK
jgi:hypothetical protein